MNKGKRIKIAIAGGVLLVAGILFVGLAKSQGVLPSRFDKALSIVKEALTPDYIRQLSRGAGECDKSATSTNCANIKTSPATSGANDTRPDTAFGTLKNTYTDAKYGFSLKYPDELILVNGGDPQLVDSRNEKSFSLKICNPESPCGRELLMGSVKTIQDIQKAYIANKYSDGAMQYTEEIRPLSNVSMQTERGISVLKQSYSIVIRDSNGTDVTERECEMCGEQKERYVVFKSSGSYFIVQVTGQSNDKSLEEKIIRSIAY